MLDLQDLSSNLLLVAFALISICSLYLLYSNFTKVREINDLKLKFEDLKTIFINQQKHNDDTYVKLMNMLKSNDIISDTSLTQINLDTNENLSNKVVNIVPNTLVNDMITKSNTLDLKDLDNLDDKINNFNDIADIADIDDIYEDDEDDEDNKNNKDTIYNDSVNKITNFDYINYISDINDLDDIESITTEPIVDDINDIMIDSIDNIIDLDNMVDLDDNDDNDNYDNNNNNNNNNNNDNDNDDNKKLDGVEDLDNLDNLDSIDDLDNLDSIEDLDNLDMSDLENINVISNVDIKPVLFNDNIISNDNTSTETIELDKLLSGDSKNSDLSDSNSKNIELTDSNSNENKNYKIEDLQNMSIKQLKDLAKLNKIKSIGNKTKIELIEILSKFIFD